MSRINVWIVTCLIAAAPSAASGAIVLDVSDVRTGPSGVPYVDLVFRTSGVNDTLNEQLAFYDIGLRLVRRSGGAVPGLRFVEPHASKVPADEGFVFTDAADFVVAEATPTTILANVAANTPENHDIVTGKKAGRLYLGTDPLTSLDTVYEIQFDPELTVFAAGAGDDPVIPVALGSALIVWPEPSGLSLLAFATLALSRRR